LYFALPQSAKLVFCAFCALSVKKGKKKQQIYKNKTKVVVGLRQNNNNINKNNKKAAATNLAKYYAQPTDTDTFTLQTSAEITA